ncbi:SHOCT domain-containing protein [Ihubacter sp. mB4P-1]|uniref:SHOCT domain-containing protein n=1 Tax=Ihubacter sp. mB4P-1 TaxID=3242370 RepID=UPI003C7C0E73
MRKMRTAEEMYEYYCEIRKAGGQGDKSLGLPKLFQGSLDKYKRAEAFLEPDEYCLTDFHIYIYVYKDIREYEEWIYILTNKRIIAVNFDAEGVDSIEWDRVSRIAMKDGCFIIETDVYRRSLSEAFVLGDQESEIIEKELEKVMPFIWKEREKQLQKRNSFVSSADEIRKFKRLWDDGIITNEEFEQKKKKLLDL